MKLQLEEAKNVLIRCLQLSESKQELYAVLKFGDRILSTSQFPNETSTDRLNAMMAFLDEFHKVNENVNQTLDNTEVDLKSGI
jgi:hypothetical protein